MGPKQIYPTRNYAVGQYLLTLRSRSKLTQAEFASRIGVHRRSVQKWESGETFPTAENLRALIAVLISLDVFSAGQELAEAAALWQQVSEATPQPLSPFDTAWFNQLLVVPTSRETADAGVILPLTDQQRPEDNQKPRLSLPFQSASIIGREAELSRIVTLLSDPACRLLTLLGPGGIGKTRLALAVAAAQTEAFSEGVAFVPLASVEATHQIISAIGEALYLSFGGQSDPSAYLLDYLRERQMLLVLDSFEHLLEETEVVYNILKHAPSVTLLVTSRARLNLQAEWLFEVQGLSYPASDSSTQDAASSSTGRTGMAHAAGVTGKEGVSAYGAVQLFVQRARQIQPHFPLPETTLTAIAHICQHVAGMPLAIELAAAGVRLLSITEIEQQIRTNLDGLATLLRDVPPRHRSLRAVFDQSWALLSEPEQVLFSRLAVFRGGCTVAAAEQVAGATLPALLALVDQSLLRQTSPETASSARERRFTLLEPIREYALERLAERGEIQPLQGAHASYYLALAEAAEAQSARPASDMRIEQLEDEYDNMRAALQWAREEGELTLGLRLAGALRWFWRRRGYINEGRLWLEELLALEDNNTDTLAARLHALEGAAWLASHQHDYARATQLFEQSMMLRWALGETERGSNLLGVVRTTTWAAVNAALEARAVGNYGRATMLLEDAVTQGRAMGDRGSLSEAGLGLWLFLLGLLCREQGDLGRAAALVEEGLALHRDLGDREGLAIGLLALSDISRDQGNIPEMRKICEESLALLRELEVQWAIGFALNNLALGAYLTGDLPQARTLINESVALFRAQKAEGSLAEVLITFGRILWAQGEGPLAYEILTEAGQFAWTVGPRLMGAAALEALASLVISPRAARWRRWRADHRVGSALSYPPLRGGGGGLEADPSLSQAQAELATRLLASASALRSQMGTPAPPVDQPLLEQTLAAAQFTLGANPFAMLWETAKALPPEQILGAIPSPASFFASLEATNAGGVLSGMEASLGDTPAAYPPAGTPATPGVSPPSEGESGGEGHIDWGLAQDVPVLYGRQEELATLAGWVTADQCRMILLVGIGGIGKTSMAVTFARQMAPHFKKVIFRSLGEAPPLLELLDQLIHSLTAQQRVAPPHLEDKLALLIELLRQERCLLILDNLETLIQVGATEAHYLAGYEAYGALLKSLAETPHQSCLLLTSRERLPELAALEGPRAPVRSLRVAGLSEAACRMLLADQALVGTAGDTAALARRYSGNPLALKLVTEPIRALFSGDIAAFLTEGSLFFEGVGQLLEQQIGRTSALEQSLLVWLAIGREPVMLDQLRQDLTNRTGRAAVLAALHALWRRNLIERGHEHLTFTLQRVVLEYLTERLVERVAEEIRQGSFDELRRYALIQATAKEYVRRSQERLIAMPLLERLAAVYGGAGAVEGQLLSLLQAWREWPPVEQGYGPGNSANLLRLLRGHLRDLDLAHLAFRQANLQGVEAQDTSLAGALIQDSLFTETFDAMTAVAVNNTGEYWAAASRRGEILIWTAGGLILHRMWRAHTDMIWTLTFSPDGRALASGSWDGRVKLWDVANGALLWSGRHTSLAKQVAFAPDGSMLASSGNDATVRLWDLRSGAQLQILPHTGPIPAITWSPAPPDGHLLATGDREGYIRLWEMQQTGPAICVQMLAAHTNWIDGLAFSPDGSILASAGWEGTIKLWNMSTLRPFAPAQESPGSPTVQAGAAYSAPVEAVASEHLRQALAGHTDWVLRLAWSPDGRTLASCSRDHTIRLWNVEQGNYQMTLQGHTAGVDGLAITPDGHNLLSGSEDGTLRAWNVSSGQCIRVIQGYAASLYDVDWSPDGLQLVSGGSDTLVTIYEVSGEKPPRVLRGHSGVVFGVGWSSNGRWLASTVWDNIIRLWDPVSGEYLQLLQYPDDTANVFYSLAWSPDGQRLASGTNRRGVHVFEMTAHHQQWAEPQFPAWIRHVAWSPDGARLAGGSEDGVVYIWDAADGALLQRLTGHHSMITTVTWGPFGRRLASGGRGREGGELFVWDPQRGERIQAITDHPRMVYTVAWGLNEDLVVSGGGDGKLRWWDVQSGACVQVREAHQGTVQSLRRSPDGTKLASCGDDGAIRLWDLRTGEPLQTLRRDRPYERLNITGIKGLTEAQRIALLALGAVET